jgi:hypothetical protein
MFCVGERAFIFSGIFCFGERAFIFSGKILQFAEKGCGF